MYCRGSKFGFCDITAKKEVIEAEGGRVRDRWGGIIIICDDIDFLGCYDAPPGIQQSKYVGW